MEKILKHFRFRCISRYNNIFNNYIKDIKSEISEFETIIAYNKNSTIINFYKNLEECAEHYTDVHYEKCKTQIEAILNQYNKINKLITNIFTRFTYREWNDLFYDYIYYVPFSSIKTHKYKYIIKTVKQLQKHINTLIKRYNNALYITGNSEQVLKFAIRIEVERDI